MGTRLSLHRRFQKIALALAAASTLLACGPSSDAQVPPPIAYQTSGDAEFDTWRDDFSNRALAQGRDRAIVGRLLSRLQADPRIIELDQRQPEFVSPVWDYVTARVSDSRIAAGLTMKSTLGPMLPAIEQRYGVDTDIVLGIWALESNFGQANLPYDAAAALATLAADGRRKAQFEGYLLALFQMVERGQAAPEQLRSSWAGALGQPQFMPDVYLTTAVDWDGDGHRDIWNNRGDVAASIAHYLQDRGWQAGQPVFDEVRLPPNFDYTLADGTLRPVSEWESRGVRRISGAPFAGAERGMASQLFLPAGAQGPALLLHPNFAVIRRYNASDRYALVVALLARAYEGRPGLATPWPTHLGSLNRDQIFELQTLLNGLGYSSGTPDGLFGSGTRRAVRTFQAAVNVTPDGFPTTDLLQTARVRSGVSIDEPPPAATPGRPLDRAGVRQLQRQLRRLRYDVGPADGRIGPDTRTAIRAFQRSQNMTITGRATSDVLTAARAARR
jgi:lytic murein transglycosylase